MHNFRQQTSRFSYSLLALAIAGAFATSGSSATLEANWSAIHLQDAWSQGFTGQGVELGIFDLGVDGDHRTFAGKEIDYLFSKEYLKDYPDGLTSEQWSKRNHGTHVAGIMAGQGYGAAQNASLVVLTPSWNDLSNTIKEIHELYIEALDAFPNVRIWNNSLGWNFALGKYAGVPQGDMPLMTEVFDKAFSTDRVLVFAAGNEGGITPNNPVRDGIQSLKYAGHLINVVNIDADHLSDPKKVLYHSQEHGNSLIQTNLGVFASVWTIAAPGTEVPSASAGTGSGTVNMSGTSMATPLVSGVLGLVEEAFPWMSSEQLTDVVLSTVTPMHEAVGVSEGVYEEYRISDVSSIRNDKELKQIFWNQSLDNEYKFWDSEYKAYEESVAVVYWNGRGDGFDITKFKTELYEKAQTLVDRKYAKALEDIEWAPDLQQAELKAKLEVACKKWIDYFVNNVVIIENSLGNGLLNAGRAVGGLATIDLNRMARWDKDNNKWMLPVGTTASNSDQINYTLTLKGDGVSRFTNDISEVRWDPALHINTVEQLFAYSDAIKKGNTDGWYENYNELKAPENAYLPIGFKVTGESREGEVNTAGTLVFAGNVRLSGEIDVLNNAVLIVNGSVAGLNSQIQTFSNKESALPGLVRSDETGTIGGTGTIQNLISYGVLSPGDDTAIDPTGTLTVTETLTIVKGTILLDVGKNKKDKIVANTIVWDGASSGTTLIGDDSNNANDATLTFHLRAGDYIAKDFKFDPKDYFEDTQSDITPTFENANATFSEMSFELKKNDNGTWTLSRLPNAMQNIADSSGLDGDSKRRMTLLDQAIARDGEKLSVGAQSIVSWLDRKADTFNLTNVEDVRSEIATTLVGLSPDDHKLLDAAILARTSRIRDIAAMSPEETLADSQTRVIATLSYDNTRMDAPRSDAETNLATVAGGMNRGLANGTFGWRFGAFTDHTEGSNHSTELKGTGVFASADLTQDIAGVRVFGGLTAGWSSDKRERQVTVADETSHFTARSESFFGSASGGAGLRIPVTDTFELFPYASLSYDLIRRGSFNEGDGAGAQSWDSDTLSTAALEAGTRWLATFATDRATWQLAGKAAWRNRFHQDEAKSYAWSGIDDTADEEFFKNKNSGLLRLSATYQGSANQTFTLALDGEVGDSGTKRLGAQAQWIYRF